MRDRDGVFHLFFHNEGRDQGSDIEHYTSLDLQRLDYVGVALRRSAAGWDADALWAPHVVESGGRYLMFYTGVEGRGPQAKQRLGVAASSDLVHWTRLPTTRPGVSGDGCVYDCDEPWTTWSDSGGSYDKQCRDAFVTWDPVHARWVLFATARSRNQFGVVTVAYSNDATTWTGAGYIDATRRLATGVGAQTTGGQCENPHVVSRDGLHYLLFTDWQDPEDSTGVRDPRTIAQYATSASLTADTSGSLHWTYRGSIPDPGVNALEALQYQGTWILSQSISNESSGAYEHRRDLRLKCIVWHDGWRFATANFGFAPTRVPHAGTRPGASPVGALEH